MIKRIMISLPEQIHERMEAEAKAEGYSLSAFIRELFKDWEKEKEQNRA